MTASSVTCSASCESDEARAATSTDSITRRCTEAGSDCGR